MSILVKGMDMPSSCADCQAYVMDSYSCLCVLMDRDVDDDTQIDEDCPLVEVKTPHGRMIDADALLFEEGQMAVIQDASYGRGREGMKNAIRNAPTVIEAEE